MVMEVVQEETGEESNIQCGAADHHFKNGSSSSSPGGICALCLQEKLGKLVSSSIPVASLPPPSSIFSPPIRSDLGYIGNNASSSTSSRMEGVCSNACECDQNHRRRAKFPFFLSHGKKKKKDIVAAATRGDSGAPGIVFQRSKSTVTHRRDLHFTEANKDHSFEKRGFWSFLYLPATKHSKTKKTERPNISINNVNSVTPHESKKEELVVVEENESPDEAAFENKVSRSRSVACGSRSFSGDFFGRISSGFGDCTLRRVESHREGKNKMHSMHRNSVTGGESDCIKERVKCGGIFSGFMIASSSSSSYCISSADEESANGKTTATPGRRHIGDQTHARKAGNLEVL